MSGSETNYSLQQVADHLLAERVVLQGVSPAVYRQNLGLVAELRDIGATQPPGLLGIGGLGSRVNGISDLFSDFELHMLRTVGYHPQGDFSARLGSLGVDVDIVVAADYLRIEGPVSGPENADAFILWARTHPLRTVGLHNEGIYDTENRRIACLAALVVRDHDARARGGRVWPSWERIRSNYADAFLGDPSRVDRMREKLSQRLAVPLEEVAAVITEDLIEERRARFGLPRDFDGYLESEMARYESSADEIGETPWHDLYRRVQTALNQRHP